MAQIVSSAVVNNFTLKSIDILQGVGRFVVEPRFVETVRQKNYSMFRLLDEERFREGLAKLEADLGKVIVAPGGGSTLLWLRKTATH